MLVDRQLQHELQSDICCTLLAAWIDWRGDNLIASRRDMRLEDIKSILSHVTLFDVISPDEIVIRLASSEQERVSEEPLRGVNLLDITASEDRALRAQRMWRMSQQPCGGWGLFPHRLKSGLEIFVEAVTMPMEPWQPDQPKQLIAALARIAGPDLNDEPQRDRVFNVSRDYRFLDVGAGVPDVP